MLYGPRSPFRRWLPLAYALVLFLGGAGRAWGQSSGTPLTLEGGVERDVNRYRWTGAVISSAQLGSWMFDVENRYRSDAFLLFDDRLSFRDENRTRFRAATATDGGGNGRVVYGSADWFSLSRVFRQEIWGGYRFWQRGRAWLEPVVGFALDARPGFGADAASAPIRSDAGGAVGVRFGVPMGDWGGYMTRAEGVAQIQHTAPRTASVLRSVLDAERTFERTRIRTRLAGSSVRRDAYQAASFLNRDDATGRRAETVESTRSDTLVVGIDVETQVARPLFITASLDVGGNARRVETLRAPADALFFDSRFQRRTVEATMAVRWEEARSRARLAMSAGAEVERRRLSNADDLPPAQAAQKLNLLRQADNERGYLSLQGLFDTEIRTGWTLHLDGSANILRHDTPEVNPDDRDELLYNAVVGTRIRVREGLEFTAQVFGSWFHTVYLKSLRSAENSVQRSIRYRPGLLWQPGPRTRLRLTSEVRATYTVDDFVLQGRRPTDQAAREMRYELDAEHQVRTGLRLMVTGSVSDLQLGRFLDEVFAEIPFDTLRTASFWARVQTGRKVQAEVGVRAFIRTDFDRAATVRYTVPETGQEATISRMGRQRIDQIGPTMAILWPMRRNAYLRLDGWATIQTVTYRLYGGLPEDRMAAIRSAAARGKRTLIPNLALTMRWGL
jgi:hypothetical protein